MASLAAALPLTLEELDLSENVISDEGAVALSKGMPQQLKVLKLVGKCGMLTQLEHQQCLLSAAGVAALAAALPLTLANLDLSYQDIGDEGTTALAEGLPPYLRSLKLAGK